MAVPRSESGGRLFVELEEEDALGAGVGEGEREGASDLASSSPSKILSGIGEPMRAL